MIGASGNGASGYQVVESPAVLAEVRRLAAGLTDQAGRRRCAAALRAIRQRLRTDPREFGEYLHPLKWLRLDMYLGFIAPWTVRYGVHQERKLVFVASYHLLS
jgi:hypothetical protein